jgi:hypothetical protein
MTPPLVRFGLGLGAFLALWVAAMVPVYAPALGIPPGSESLAALLLLLLGSAAGYLFLRAERAAVGAAGDVGLVDQWKKQIAWGIGLAGGLHAILVVLCLPIFLNGPGRALVAFTRKGDVPILQLVSDPLLAVFYLLPLLPPLTLLLLVPMLASQRRLNLSLWSLDTVNVTLAAGWFPLLGVALLQFVFAKSEWYQTLRRMVEQAAGG